MSPAKNGILSASGPRSADDSSGTRRSRPTGWQAGPSPAPPSSSSDPWPTSRDRPSSCSIWPIKSKNRSNNSSSEADACHSAFLCKVLGMYSGQLESKHQGLGEKIAEACQEVYVTVRERELA